MLRPLPVSLCMIVRDGADDLAALLEAVKGWVAQIVVVDTGSEDDSLTVAARAGAEVHTFAWCDDFSAARNSALGHADQPWILVLDADERLEPTAYDAIAACIQTDVDAYVVTYRNYTTDLRGDKWIPNDGRYPQAAAWPGWVAGQVIRLFRNDLGLRFAGRVHEVIQTRGKRVAAAPFLIHHLHEEHGRDYVAAKQRRYMRLLEMEIAEGHGTAKQWTDVAVIRREFCEDSAGALDALSRAVELDPGYQRAWHERIGTAIGLRMWNDAETAYQQILSRWPDDTVGWCAKGLVARERRDLAAAAAALGEVLKRSPHHVEARLAIATILLQEKHPEEALPLLRRLADEQPGRPAIVRNLSAAYAMLGDNSEAGAVLDRAVALLPNDVGLWNNLGVIRAQSGDAEGAVQAFEHVLNLEPDNADARHNLTLLT